MRIDRLTSITGTPTAIFTHDHGTIFTGATINASVLLKGDT